MIATIKTIDPHAFVGLELTKVELDEFVLKLYFGDNRLDIECWASARIGHIDGKLSLQIDPGLGKMGRSKTARWKDQHEHSSNPNYE